MSDLSSSVKAARRPIAARANPLIGRLVALLLRTPISPNQISVLSVFFAAASATALIEAARAPWLYLAAIFGVQLRLLCNLLDGMVAVEGGRASATGALYNEVPDRIADSLLIVALGYAVGAPALGWAGALFAALTAYIRVLGGTLGLPQDFRGPMAKPHRMAALTAACALAPLEAYAFDTKYALTLAAWLIAAGSLATCATRLRAMAQRLKEARAA
ncbi:CDP-alcohol phosphatidyltransferase family protein [Methylosinus sp. Sm6]|uniref:CDP-alcohol phosphatidyltransferase family protein n=1 Tax=Methylosinus sp. Sm6 TaxID=2866948 RepID=UPI001C99D2C0|nr:CDP-alcohol phosphatidyltransferase family protein [Methylosinus sp. Sm6]MBY6240305.1 CDP-alcohol phosphatidyltransferase family protein [Methylosinus sp. Sm6]